MQRVRGKRRCFACGKMRWIVRSGTRPSGFKWYLCRACHDDFHRAREHDREMWEMLKARGE